jgi:hypothetical protein
MIFMNHPSRTLNIAGALAAVLLLAAGRSGAQTNSTAATTHNSSSNNDSPPSYSSFQIISQRNIFDPNRRSQIRRTWTQQPSHNHNVVDSFSLVGTMSYPKGKFAFFDGTSFQYKKVLQPGGNIAGYTVKDITPKAVTLTANGKDFEMPVGKQLRNEGSNSWKMADHVEAPSTNDSNGDTTANTPSALPSASNPQMSDVLKKLMQQREQELK